jgi:hypothetical protein
MILLSPVAGAALTSVPLLCGLWLIARALARAPDDDAVPLPPG